MFKVDLKAIVKKPAKWELIKKVLINKYGWTSLKRSNFVTFKDIPCYKEVTMDYTLPYDDIYTAEDQRDSFLNHFKRFFNI